MPIPTVPVRVRRYLADFNTVAIAITSKGRVIVTPNPSGCERAWWLSKRDARRLHAAARAKGDVEGAAKRLDIGLTPHDVALMRADRALIRLDGILRKAQEAGELKTFNAEYAARRRAAVAAGRRFMGYPAAQARLRRALAACVADGCQGRPFSLVLRDVFRADIT
jgi:hypothetical protein